MIRSSLCDYNDAYIHIKGTITIPRTAAAGANPDNRKNCTPLTNCISKINNTQVDNAEGIDVVMPMYNLIECNNVYSKASGSL